MDTSIAQNAQAAPTKLESIGRIATVTGSQSTVELAPRVAGTETATVGKFMGLTTGKTVIIGLITEVGEQSFPATAAGHSTFRKIALLDLIGELRADSNGKARFQRGVTEYPNIGDGAFMLTEAELRIVYGAADSDHAYIGDLQQNP